MKVHKTGKSIALSLMVPIIDFSTSFSLYEEKGIMKEIFDTISKAYQFIYYMDDLELIQR